MREKNVKEIVRYYYEIPEMVRLLKTEQREQESLYDTLKGTGGDGMPGGGGPGKPVEAAVIRLDERGVYERLQEIHVRLLVLEGDAAAVRGCLDGLSGKYKSIRRNFRSADARFIFYAFYASGQMFVATISTPVPSMFAQTTSPILTGALISSFAISLTQSLTLSFGTAFADLTGTTG